MATQKLLSNILGLSQRSTLAESNSEQRGPAQPICFLESKLQNGLQLSPKALSPVLHTPVLIFHEMRPLLTYVYYSSSPSPAQVLPLTLTCLYEFPDSIHLNYPINGTNI